MVYLRDCVELSSGTPQFRISESADAAAPIYYFYAQSDLEDDLKGLIAPGAQSVRRQIRTFDAVCTASEGEVVFSLLSGTAAIVGTAHQGYVLTQNYVVLSPSKDLDPRYLVYLLNESRWVRRQLRQGQQGSITMKYTIKQLNTLGLPPLPSLEKQGVVGELYLNQLKLDALRKRASELDTALVLGTIREASQS